MLAVEGHSSMDIEDIIAEIDGWGLPNLRDLQSRIGELIKQIEADQ